MNIKNPRTYDINEFIDVDICLSEEGENGDIISGEWMPHTILPDDSRYTDLINGEYGEVVIESPPRNISVKYNEAMAQGVLWNGERLVVDNANARDRILAAATRLFINNTLPKNKDSLEYPTVDGKSVLIAKENVQSVALLIQDFTEDCYNNYLRLVSNQTQDINSGWPQ